MAIKAKQALIGAFSITLLGSGAAWYVMSGQLVNNARAMLNDLNGKTLIDNTSYRVTYEHIGRTSFPSIGVRLTNPSLEILLPAKAANIPPAIFSYKVKGTTDTTANYLKHRYNIVTDGVTTFDMGLGSEHMAVQSEPKKVKAYLEARDRETFDLWKRINFANQQQLEQALKGVAALGFESGQVVYKDPKTNEMLFRSDAYTLDFLNRSDEKTVAFDVKAHVKGMEASHLYGVLTKAAMLSMSPTTPFFSKLPFAPERAGKQDMDVDLSVDVPRGNGRGLLDNGGFDMRKLYVKNDFYTINAPMFVRLKQEDNQYNAAIKLDITADITAKGAGEMQSYIDQGIELAQDIPVAESQRPVLREKILAAMPTVSTLGPIHFVLDVNSTKPLPQPGQTGQLGSNLQINKFEFSHKRWAMDANGTLITKAGASAPEVNAQLLCKQCSNLTQDIYTTATQAEEVANMVAPQHKPWGLSEEKHGQLNQLLAESATRTGDDLTFIFKTATPGDIRLNDKPLAEFSSKLMMLVIPEGAMMMPAGVMPQATPEANSAAPAAPEQAAQPTTTAPKEQ